MKNEVQLNISAPLLTTRKHLSPRAPAVGTVAIVTEKPALDGHISLFEDRSEWESEQVRTLIAVPFLWEKTPGTPKDYVYHSDEVPAITPRTAPETLFDVCSLRPPPGRLVDVNHIAGGVCSPRLSSGTLADETHISGLKSMVQNNWGSQVEALSVIDHASLLESLKESLDADGEDSGDDAFYDALDTSLSLQSSVSGLSSSYHHNCGLSGNFSADLETRDFIMSRFLPAAKAAAAHTPRHVPNKPTVVIGHYKTVNKVSPSKRKSPLKAGVNARPSSNQHHWENGEIHEDVEYDDPEIRIGKTCGFFQRFCVKNVVSHRNLKYRMLNTQSSKHSSREVKKLTTKACGGRPVDKVTYPSEVTSQELPEVFNKLTDESKRISFSSNSHKMADILSPTICPKNREAYPVFSERLPSPIREGSRFLGLPRPMEPKTDETIPLLERDESNIEVPTSTCNSKLPGVSLIKQRCDHERNFLALEEHKGSDNYLVNGKKKSNWAVLLPPIPPPSPKTPSESWLWRTLPPIYFQNYFSHSHGDSRLQSVSKNKQPSSGLKVVKSSKGHHDHHVHFSKVTR